MYRFLLLNILPGVIGGYLAYRKGRNTFLWGLICAIFPPLVLIISLLPMTVAGGRTKICPYCTRVISEKEGTCRYCARELPIAMKLCPFCGGYVPDKDYCIRCSRKMGT